MKVIISHFNTIAIATPLMKRVHEKHSSTFIRHAGEFLHMDHYEFTHVFILFINLLVIELFYGRSLSGALGRGGGCDGCGCTPSPAEKVRLERAKDKLTRKKNAKDESFLAIYQRT